MRFFAACGELRDGENQEAEHARRYGAWASFFMDLERKTRGLMRRSGRSVAILSAILLTTTWSEAAIPMPIAYWSFDGDATDGSGNGRDGTLEGGAFDSDVPAPIGAGMSLVLDATHQEYVGLDALVGDFALLSEGSISAWFKTSGPLGAIFAASQTADASSELRLLYESDAVAFDAREEFGADFAEGALTSAAGLGDGTWHHVVVTVDSESNASLYVDGALVAVTREPFFSSVQELDSMSIGRNVDVDNPGGQWFFNGSLDDLAVWDQVLTCDEVAALSIGVSPLDEGGDTPDCECAPDEALPLPSGYWNFDGNVDDRSGLEHHGVLAGLAGGPTFDSDVPAAIGGGEALLFDEFNQDHVDLSAHVGQFADLERGTVSAWMKTTDPTIGVLLAASDSSVGSNEFRFFYEGIVTLRCGVRADGNRWMSRSTVDTNDGFWHHVAVTVSEEGNTLWVDGEPISVTYEYGNSASTDFFAAVPNLDTMGIGRNVDSGAGTGQWFFTGSLDDVSIYDRPLTCGQIAALAGGLPVPTPKAGDMTPPSVPTGLLGIAEDGEVQLNWDDNSDLDFAHYVVYRSETSGAGFKVVANELRASKYLDSDVVNGTTYFYTTSAVDRSGNESAMSAEVEVTPLEDLDVTPPSMPQNLSAGGLDGRIELDWDDNPEADLAGYDVGRSLVSGGLYTTVATAISASEYRDEDVDNGTIYYYVVTAIDEAGNRSEPSSEAEATPAAVEIPLPFAYWPLDEGGGQIVRDLSGNEFDGVLGNSEDGEPSDPTWTESVIDGNGVTRGPVLDFGGDPRDHWVDLSPWIEEFATLDEGTISAWIKLTGNDGVDVVVAMSDSNDPSSELRFFYERNLGIPGIRYDIRNDGNDAFPQVSSFPTDVNDDNWRHVAVTVDSAGLASVFVDGILANSATEAGFFAAIADANVFSIGRNVDSGGSQWHYLGPMSDVAVWDRPLEAEQIFALAIGSPVPTPNSNDQTPPDAPTGLLAIANDSFVLLDWDNNSEKDLLGFRLYRSEISGGPYEVLELSLAGSGFVDQTAVNGTTYYYVVSALDRALNESDPSAEVSATPLEGLDGIAPAAPADLAAVGFDGENFLQWPSNEEDDIAGYNVYRATIAGGPYDLVAGGVAESEHADNGVENGTTYYYVVTALDMSDNESETSNEASATPSDGEIPAPFAYWPLDEGEGQDVFDLSDNGYDGFLGEFFDKDVGDPVWVESVTDANGVTRGPVLDFAGDGKPQWVTLSDWVVDFAELTQGTISAWVKLTGDDVVDVILAASDPLDPSSEIRFFYDPIFQGIPGLRYDVVETAAWTSSPKSRRSRTPTREMTTGTTWR